MTPEVELFQPVFWCVAAARIGIASACRPELHRGWTVVAPTKALAHAAREIRKSKQNAKPPTVGYEF